jgi:hypothetical protein
MKHHDPPSKDDVPVASRPYMPGYGILPANEGRGLMPWEWAVERLTRARNYWIATASVGGQPHCVPVWGVWLDDAFYFSSGAQSRKARNIAANPKCVVCPENGDEAVSLEGAVEKVIDAATLKRFVEAYNPKYGWDLKVETVLDLGPVFAVRPRKVLGFDDTPEEFAGSATRWTFR